MSETLDLLEQPPFVPDEAAELARSVPATVAGLPPTAQTFFAVVDANGVLVRGFQAVSATKLGVGIYQVLFSHSIVDSAYIGTIGLPGSIGASPHGGIAVVGRSGAPNGVFVQTFDSAGAFADRGFHLTVHS